MHDANSYLTRPRLNSAALLDRAFTDRLTAHIANRPTPTWDVPPNRHCSTIVDAVHESWRASSPHTSLPKARRLTASTWALISERGQHRAHYTKARNAIRQIVLRRTFDDGNTQHDACPTPHSPTTNTTPHSANTTSTGRFSPSGSTPWPAPSPAPCAATRPTSAASPTLRAAADNADAHTLFKTLRHFRHPYPCQCQPSAPTSADAGPIFTDAARARAYAAHLAALQNGTPAIRLAAS